MPAAVVQTWVHPRCELPALAEQYASTRPQLVWNNNKSKSSPRKAGAVVVQDGGDDGTGGWWGLRFAVHPTSYSGAGGSGVGSGGGRGGEKGGGLGGSGGGSAVEWAVSPCTRCDASHLDLAQGATARAAVLDARSNIRLQRTRK